MLTRGILLAYVVISCGGMSVSCNSSKDKRAPKQEAAWTGRPGKLLDNGYGSDHVYAHLSALPAETHDRLVIWTWDSGIMKETTIASIPDSLRVTPLIDGLCGLSFAPEDKSANWPYALLDLDNNSRIIERWDSPEDWWFSHAGASIDGTLVALLAKEEASALGHDWMKPRVKVGLIDVRKRDLRWVGELQGQGDGTIRSLAVTNDARRVAVAGWNNGTAMVDCETGKVMWEQRPEHEVSTGYAVFAPDGKLIYTAGSEGCVYGIDVATGDVVNQRWATSTGESIYAHRVTALAISGDGVWLAAGTSPEGEVYIWNLQKDDKPRVLDGGRSVQIVAFSPDSENIVTVGGGKLKVWPNTVYDE